jgi:proline iminopeptidase
VLARIGHSEEVETDTSESDDLPAGVLKNGGAVRASRWSWWQAALAALVVALLAACQTDGDYFFLERDGAVMPIWIRGNADSGTYVLVVHGGPASTAQWYIDMPAFQALERRYAVVYWDQRASGTSQGAPPASTFTPDEYVGDMDAVVRLLRARRSVKHLFVFGHSWGGYLGTAYLIAPEHQQGVDGYVMMDGGFVTVRGFELARQFVAAYAQERLAAGADASTWAPILAWVTQTPAPAWTPENITRLAAYVHASRRNFWNAANEEPPTLSWLLLSPFDVFAYLKHTERSLTNYDLAGLDLTAQMASVQVPTLITWGRHDGILPVALAHEAYDALGTAPSDKSVVIFEDSAHTPCIEEATAWTDAVTTFIDARTVSP